MKDCIIRPARADDLTAAYHICLKTGDRGKDGEPFYRDDPDALARIYVGPYFKFALELGVVLEDAQGVCGYSLGALDTRVFFARYETEWRPALVARFPAPSGDPVRWTRVQQIHHLYHHPDYFAPEPYADFPSHLHIDLLERAQGRGFGRRMIEQVLANLRDRGSPGAHLGVSTHNVPAQGFYARLGFREIARTGTATDGCIYLAKRLNA
jgi:ribosomal protein S18 acetylase RimI-like enzyme